MFDVYIQKVALEKAHAHAAQGAAAGEETMGLLVGNVYSYQGRKWVLVEDYVTAKNKATSVSVKFSKDSFSSLAQKIFPLVSTSMVIVGWMHSHPGLDCFLSYTDLDTQQKFFNSDWAIAAVCDPSKAEQGLVKTRVYRLSDPTSDHYSELSYAVIS